MSEQKTIYEVYEKTTPFQVCDLVFVEYKANVKQLTEDFYPTEGYARARTIIVHGVNILSLDYVAGGQNITRSKFLQRAKKEIFAKVLEEEIETRTVDLDKLLDNHVVSVICHELEDEDGYFLETIDFKQSHVNGMQENKMINIIKENNFINDQIVDLYVMVYYGCTNQEVINMITWIKRDRYVNDLEGFFEKRLYARELAEDIAENTRYYREHFEMWGEPHPDLTRDNTKF